jgi:hypothetical protein
MPEKEFGLVRMGGTIGWILAAWPLYFVLQGKEGVAAADAASRNIFLVSGVTSLALAAYSLTPPAHAPQAHGRRRPDAGIAWLKAAGYLSQPYLLVLFRRDVHRCGDPQRLLRAGRRLSR